MSPDTYETLIVLRRAGASDSLKKIKNKYPVTSLLPPRLAIAQVDAAGQRELEQSPDVEAVILGQAQAALLESLEENERLFVDAWLLRRQKEKVRPGDKLPWDTPGFQPPDKQR